MNFDDDESIKAMTKEGDRAICDGCGRAKPGLRDPREGIGPEGTLLQSRTNDDGDQSRILCELRGGRLAIWDEYTCDGQPWSNNDESPLHLEEAGVKALYEFILARVRYDVNNPQGNS